MICELLSLHPLEDIMLSPKLKE